MKSRLKLPDELSVEAGRVRIESGRAPFSSKELARWHRAFQSRSVLVGNVAAAGGPQIAVQSERAPGLLGFLFSERAVRPAEFN